MLIVDVQRTASGTSNHTAAASQSLTLQTHIEDALLTHA